jgi:hypothetical protein
MKRWISLGWGGLCLISTLLVGCGSDAGGAGAATGGGSGTGAAGSGGGGAGGGGTSGGGSGGGGTSAGGGSGGGGTSAGGGSGGGGTSAGGGSGGGIGPGPSIAGCPVFPADNEWNRDISGDEVDPNSDNYIAFILANGGKNLHPDFGSNPDYGIPYTVVEESQAMVPMSFDYADESDPGPYPFPPDAPIEGGPNASGDRHVLVIQKGACKLFETFDSHFVGPGWHAGSGAVFDLTSNALRPDGWTSADAAGLPIFPGLVRYDEAVTAGEIRHALRFTVSKTQKAYVHPATHYASSNTDPNAPPMGLRLRLKASYDLSGFTGASLAVMTALKKYGMIVADNGSNWYISGASNPGFDDDELGQLKAVPGSAFEVVKVKGKIYKP